MTFDWSIYTGSYTWLPNRTIYVTRHGSHAYGTQLPTSDLDLRGVAIAPMAYYAGFVRSFEQATQATPDLTVFDIRKFFRLCADCNPNALEILYTDASDHLLIQPPMSRLLAERDRFLSQKARHTFSGYANAQLKRIHGHYRWLKDPPKAPPTRAEYRLPERAVIPGDQLAAAEAGIRKQIDAWSWHELEDLDPSTRQAIQGEFFRRLTEITRWSWQELDDQIWVSAARTLGYDSNFIELLDLERRYNAKQRDWQQYQTWKANRNPDRARLEEKYGYDTKHGMHLIRLLRMCREILTEGKVVVRRPDAEELLAIRAGAWNYLELVAWAERQDAELAELAKTSALPRSPDLEALDALCVELVSTFCAERP